MEESERSQFTKRELGAGRISNGTLTFQRDFNKNKSRTGDVTMKLERGYKNRATGTFWFKNKRKNEERWAYKVKGELNLEEPSSGCRVYDTEKWFLGINIFFLLDPINDFSLPFVSGATDVWLSPPERPTKLHEQRRAMEEDVMELRASGCCCFLAYAAMRLLLDAHSGCICVCWVSKGMYTWLSTDCT